MHNTMTSIRSVWCMVGQKENHIQHNANIDFLMKATNTWLILTLVHMKAKWNQQHGIQT